MDEPPTGTTANIRCILNSPPGDCSECRQTLTVVYDSFGPGLRTDSAMICYGRPWDRLNRARMARFGRRPHDVGATPISFFAHAWASGRQLPDSSLNVF
ncbi:hypothetical protein [Desulforamulus hydrothermalis]|uniref:hypothetical protein n=1 Tax=Desulforamulus hydrothermalis TaxID=412895 RepID=UPI0011600E40|nr:hypothetical protein [Desulforamulus hydrothermalis]